ncbi:P-II family nitrogen regulator [Leptospirillum ferrooxidans]|jgi:nitrogen regulatory protein PII 2|uniref:Nitrogen regulatory protein PII glnB-like protein 2 n=1 Tax=Leptospirillum ferrooxidans (strain C2-3) TaxID=1162668 RepID=I0IS41_LEPFC|nr:P-II family nitrogen regulator [Leptospirillum ferrooxidans]MDA8149681.1 P-II family nitrogen regulator [Nitrospiraceae bacterium]BAM08090.1 nitrogen regulatory protein PII glnB-like protein 2 [Leptospirillum ferrooxidans C2-3]
MLVEITAILRRDKVGPTMKGLDAMGLGAMTLTTVNGRGLQGGNVMTDIDRAVPAEYESVSKIVNHLTPASFALSHSLTRPVFWIPKRMIQIVVPTSMKNEVIDLIMSVNRTGWMGDGKIFVSPIEESLRIRTGEHGTDSVL